MSADLLGHTDKDIYFTSFTDESEWVGNSHDVISNWNFDVKLALLLLVISLIKKQKTQKTNLFVYFSLSSSGWEGWLVLGLIKYLKSEQVHFSECGDVDNWFALLPCWWFLSIVDFLTVWQDLEPTVIWASGNTYERAYWLLYSVMSHYVA